LKRKRKITMSTVDENSSVASKSHMSHQSDAAWSGNGASSNGATPPPQPVYKAPVVASSEDIAIRRVKILVALVLLSALIAVVTTTSMLVQEQEQRDFENVVSTIVMYTRRVPPSSPSTILHFL
jgi:hypothetical protein